MDEIWWCNTHQRRATAVREIAGQIEHCCEPGLGGIMLPCGEFGVVELTGMVELIKEGAEVAANEP